MGGRVRSRGILLVCALLVAIALAPVVSAWTFDCTIRLNSSCLSNETLLVRLNSSEAGAAPNNSHAQLANYSGGLYNYSVCCWTDTFRNLNNACVNRYTTVLKLAETNNSHVQAGNMSGYAWNACLNATGTIACTYPTGACASGYSGILSLASSEAADGNLTNAHLATFPFYDRKVCCALLNTPPNVTNVVVASTIAANSTAGNLTATVTVTDIDPDNLSITHDWRVNGTSIAVLNMNFDVNDSAGTGMTRDYSMFGNNGTVNGAVWNATGGYNRTGAYLLNSSTNITILAVPTPVNFSVVWWHYGLNRVDFNQVLTAANGWGAFQFATAASGGIYVGTDITNRLSPTELPAKFALNTWQYFAFTYDGTNGTFYINGTWQASKAMNAPTTWGGFIIGYNSAASGINGSIDDLRIYNRSLSAQQVLALYNNRSDLIVSQELTATQNWTDCVVANDGINDSNQYCSNGLYVLAKTPPQKVNLTYPLHNNQSVFERSINFTWTTAVEADGDQVNYTLSVVVTPGACSVQSTLTNLQTTNRTVGELCVDQKYNWTVNACDVDGCSGNTTLFNFTIASVIGIQLAGNVTDFGILTLLQNNATDGLGGPNPLVLENNGNVYVNVSLNASQSPFTSVGLGNAAFQYRVADNETGSFNASGSQIVYATVPSGVTAAIKQLNFTDAADSVLIHTNITVPSAEPPGTKSTNLTLRAVVSQTP